MLVTFGKGKELTVAHGQWEEIKCHFFVTIYEALNVENKSDQKSLVSSSAWSGTSLSLSSAH